jgi:hypothetical protein
VDTNRLPKQALQYKPQNEETQDRGRDGGTNFILKIKEQETRLTLQEHNDDDDSPKMLLFIFAFPYISVMLCAYHSLPYAMRRQRLSFYLPFLKPFCQQCV